MPTAPIAPGSASEWLGAGNGTGPTAARQLQEVQANWTGPDSAMHNALLFNRRLWSIFMSDALRDENPQPDIRTPSFCSSI